MEEFAAAEVAQADVFVSRAIQHDVFRLDVPVSNVPDLMAVVERREQASEVPFNLSLWEPRLGLL